MFYEGRQVKEVSVQKCKKTLVVGEMAWQVFIDCGGKLGFHKLGFNPGVPIRRASLGYGNSRLSFLASEYVLCSTGFLSCTSIQYCSTAANLKSRSWLCGVVIVLCAASWPDCVTWASSPCGCHRGTVCPAVAVWLSVPSVIWDLGK